MAFHTDGKGVPLDDEGSDVWYHGSPEALTTLSAGSSITRNRRLAEAFSHKPSRMSISNNGHISHNGTTAGYLYVIDEPVGEEDAHVHAGIDTNDPWEWITEREFRLRLIGVTTVSPEDRLD